MAVIECILFALSPMAFGECLAETIAPPDPTVFEDVHLHDFNREDWPACDGREPTVMVSGCIVRVRDGTVHEPLAIDDLLPDRCQEQPFPGASQATYMQILGGFEVTRVCTFGLFEAEAERRED